MKKIQGIDKEIKKLKAHLNQLTLNDKTKSMGGLLNKENILRKKMKIILYLFDQLEEMNERNLYEAYLLQLKETSKQILTLYNEENETEYQLEEVIEGFEEEYIQTGVLSILLSHYLPELMHAPHHAKLPTHPKDEYPRARQMKRKFYLHLGETNTGKTYQAMKALEKGKNGIYLAPLRLLALENYEKMNQDGVPCHLLTGEEEVIVDGAQHISCTIEKLDLELEYDVAVIDEVQLIQDSVRGSSWTRAILGILSPEIHLCGALNAKSLLIQMITECGDEYQCLEYTRNVPLQFESMPYQLNRPEKGDALIAFSKKKVLELSRYYQDRGYKTSIIYGDLPPEVRRVQYQSFIEGESELLISTDAIGMGVNLPIRRIVFVSVKKFDGEKVRELTSQEVKQIAGRAGRKGIYDIGYVAAIDENLSFVEEKLKCKDEVINQAVIGPHESMLEIQGIPLIEKLMIWEEHYRNLEHYKQMDIEGYLYVLGQIKRYKLSQWAQWKIMKLPINVMQPELLHLLLIYIEEYFMNDNREITKPLLHAEDLEVLETHYQEVNLYYSFSKAFHLDFDINWVYRERSKISKKLNYLLWRL